MESKSYYAEAPASTTKYTIQLAVKELDDLVSRAQDNFAKLSEKLNPILNYNDNPSALAELRSTEKDAPKPALMEALNKINRSLRDLISYQDSVESRLAL